MQFSDVRASHLFFIMVFESGEHPGVGVEPAIKLASAYVHTIVFLLHCVIIVWFLSTEANGLLGLFPLVYFPAAKPGLLYRIL